MADASAYANGDVASARPVFTSGAAAGAGDGRAQHCASERTFDPEFLRPPSALGKTSTPIPAEARSWYSRARGPLGTVDAKTFSCTALENKTGGSSFPMNRWTIAAAIIFTLAMPIASAGAPRKDRRGRLPKSVW